MALSFVLLGCSKTLALSPITSAVQRQGQTQNGRNLSSEQVKVLDGWLQSQAQGWHRSPASYLPCLELAIVRSNGHKAWVHFLPSGLVVVNGAEGQLVKQISPTELDRLFQKIQVQSPVPAT